MIQIKTGRIKDFFKVTENIYDKNSPYVSLLNSDLERFLSNKNPLFSRFGKGEFFVAYRDNKPIGRIVSHIHEESNRRYEWARGYFGYFDCEKNEQTAKVLLGAAETWAKDNGMSEIQGNFNLTAMQQIGVVTDGFDKDVFTDQVYSPRYIAKFLEENGYEPYFPMSTFEINLEKIDLNILFNSKVGDILDNKEYELKKVKKKKLKRSLEEVRLLLNDGFSENPMFVPLSGEEFMFQAKDMMWIMDEHISYMAYKNKVPVGVVVCIPDLNPFLKSIGSKASWKALYYFIKHKINKNRAVIIFYSVSKDHQGLGINSSLLYRVIGSLKKRGYKRLGTTWASDENEASLRQLGKMGASKLHSLHLYKKNLRE